jgi:protein-S-isoprenylcysteine O-methyltransferase Ste14
VNLLGAAVVAIAARQALMSYIGGHRLIGVVFFVQQVWVAVAFLVRRPASVVTGRPVDWMAAWGGSFGGFLLRPSGLHPAWGILAGLTLQLLGLSLWAVAFVKLGRSFGLVAADRGLVTTGPYSFVRHPLYASYLLAQLGYFLQSVSAWNAAVIAFTWACQLLRISAEERLLVRTNPAGYGEYRERVRWRLLPLVW